MCQPIRACGGHLGFPIGSENTNLVEGIEYLLPVNPESSSSEDIFNYVMEMFKTNDIDIKKLVGFTADGASNMQGLKTGLAARLLVDTPHLVITHCVAHRLELAFKDAIKASSKSMYDRAMTLLLGLHYLYKKSPKMKKSLKRSFAALNQKQILPTRVGGTRWLPHELIFHLMKLSLYLQREGLVLSDAYVRVEATKNVLAQLDKRYSKELVDQQLTWATVNHGCSDLGNILSLIELVLSLPATSVRNECLFSAMKLVKGKRRGRLTNSTLDDLLLIAVQSPSINDFDPDDAILHWMVCACSQIVFQNVQKCMNISFCLNVNFEIVLFMIPNI
ncbi:hypothetical protein FSP39_014367 [Pinctada imbricata]|uniref:Zinc finger protein 862 n=1 Tax=Pinctada imbricata TaxID=66713 RepID=A0AA88XIU7_PINIB|nr:hypothetical protein FSP39_014367 [Pinctada imbricata]